MAVDPVGVRDDGEMEIPEDADRAGWYRFGPAPADPAGATVVAAHVDSVQTGIGQFARLRDVAVGAAVTVTTADGGAARVPCRDRREGGRRTGRPSTSGSTGPARRGSCS